MNRNILTSIFGYVGTFTLGGVFGAVLVFVLFTRPSIQLLSLATIAKSGQNAYTLSRHIEQLTENDSTKVSPSDSLDIALSYARLAMLAEKEGKNSEGKSYGGSQ